jgi:hypothetical protein
MTLSLLLLRSSRAALLGIALLPTAPLARTARVDSAPPAPHQSGFTLRESRFDAVPTQGSRYSVRARFQAEESAGELREGERFALIGRLAKTGVGCDASVLFRNGFEGS